MRISSDNVPPVISATESASNDGFTNLVLSRKRHEKILIDDGNIAVTVVEIKGDKVRLAINAPTEQALFPINGQGWIINEQATPTEDRPEVWNIQRLNAVGPLIKVSIVSIRGNRVRISVSTLPQINIQREEVAATPSDLEGGLVRALKTSETVGIFAPDPSAIIRYTP